MFINREHELESLERRYTSREAEFVVMYGRRRVGKTTLIKKFFENKRHLYFLADMQKEEILLNTFSEVVRNETKKEYLEFNNWDGLFKFITDIAKNERIVVAFDEVGYINKANPAFYSILQRMWDEKLRDTNIFLILCGSSISMMERDVLGYGSPLYGRRTGQIELDPMPYKDARAFFPKLGERERIEFYSILGGVPAYLKLFDEGKDVFENIRENILHPEMFLYKEPKFILLEELRDPTTYFSILTAISQGARRFNEISQKSYVEQNKLSKYLSVLLNLRLIDKITPVTERKEFKRNTLYNIDDRLFKFWFEFVSPYISPIETGDRDIVIKEIKANFNIFVSHAFEDVCRQFLWELNRQQELPTTLTKVGTWWHKEEEIDIVAVNEKKKTILFAECKWQDKKIGKRVAMNLLTKKDLVDWHRTKRKEHFALFSKSGYEKSCMDYCRENNISTFDLSDFSLMLNRKPGDPTS